MRVYICVCVCAGVCVCVCVLALWGFLSVDASGCELNDSDLWRARVQGMSQVTS